MKRSVDISFLVRVFVVGIGIFVLLQILDLFIFQTGEGLGFPFKYWALGWFGLSKGFSSQPLLLVDLLFAFVIAALILWSRTGILIAMIMVVATQALVSHYERQKLRNLAGGYDFKHELAVHQEELKKQGIVQLIHCASSSPCKNSISLTIKEDGQVLIDGSNSFVVSAGELEQLRTAIGQADFSTVRVRSGENLCLPNPATTYYVFATGTSSFAGWTCSSTIDETVAPFSTVREVLARHSILIPNTTLH
jgi:hypothetical protein